MKSIKHLELDNNFEITNCTRIKNIDQHIMGGTILNQSISIGDVLHIKKNNNVKDIEIDKILEVNNNHYKVINSNITVVIERI